MEPTNDNLDLALDTLSALVKEYGQYGFDLPDVPAEELKGRTERWAKHILFATATSESASEANGKRDWNGLRGFFSQHRQKESEYVGEAFQGTRQVMRSFVHMMGQSLQEDSDADSRVQDQLQHLEAAANQGDMNVLRDEALRAITLVNRDMTRRRERQKMQMEEIYERLQKLEWQLQQAREENNLDALTRVYNRRVLEEQMQHALDMLTVFGEPATLLLVDADHFKSINDTHGHAAGDIVLRHLANAFALAVPSKNDCVARFGGEEFGIVLADSNTAQGVRVGERILQAVRGLNIVWNETKIPVTVSIGVAETLPGESAIHWLERADKALYTAKSQGRNRLIEATAPPPAEQRRAA